MIWPFKSKKTTTEPEPPCVVHESIQPPDIFIDSILYETYFGDPIPRQYVNSAAEQIGELPKYYVQHPITVRSYWVLYEGCKAYKEKQNDTSTDS